MSDVQKARDYATQQQFTADVVNFYNEHNYEIDGKDAKEFLQELTQTPAYQAEALEIAQKCAREVAMAVFVEVFQEDPKLLANLRKNWVQAGLLSAQQSYAETGDPDEGTGDIRLGRNLAKLVAQMIIDPDRGFKGRVLRRAIDIAPNLTRQQMNSLSVLAIFATSTFHGSDLGEIAVNMERLFAPYYGDIPTRDLEYSYMESSGVGSLLIGTSIYERIVDKHRPAMRKPFLLSDVPTDVSEEDRAVYLEDDPKKQGLVRLRQEKIDELVGAGALDRLKFKLDLKSGRSIRSLRSFVSEKMIDALELKELIAGHWPDLSNFLNSLNDARAFNFQVNTIGYMLAKQELDLRFPGSDILGPLLQLSEASPADAAEPHSAQPEH